MGFGYGVLGRSMNEGLISRIEVLNTSFDGIFAAGHDNEIADNVIQRTEVRHGLVVNGDRNSVCENRVDQSFIHGLAVNGNENTVCSNVVAFTVWGSGIAIPGNGSTIELNRSYSSGSFGIDDRSLGDGTSGTANLHVGNVCNQNISGDSSPPGLCW
jgi:hypothetical protein